MTLRFWIMTERWIVPAWAALAVLAALVLLLVLLGAVIFSRRSARGGRGEAYAEVAALRARVEEVERRLARPAPTRVEDQEFTITHIGEPDVEEASALAVPVLPAPLFADLVLREGVVQAASLAAGVRRALAPQTRHRIRFEMRREVKRARRQRRLEAKQARREWEARQREEADAA